MKITIVGAGKVATGLARFWLANGHQVTLTFSRDADKLRRIADSIGAHAGLGDLADIAAEADLIVLATPWGATRGACETLHGASGKVVMSCVNALKDDLSGLTVGTTTSAAEIIASWLPNAKVVQALPPFAELLQSGSVFVGKHPASIFVAGDDSDAKKVVKNLLIEIGVDVVDAGPLAASRYIEPAMFLLVHLAYKVGIGAPLALMLLKDEN